jgi:4-hydroxy-tetrahydrodipicolinate synthase
MTAQHDIISRLRHALIPALPRPFRDDRVIDEDSHERMAEYMNDMPVAGVAVWAHTGRGLYLTEAERSMVLTHWREAMPTRLVIAGVGCPASHDGVIIDHDDDYFGRTRMMALHAKELGANAVLAYPPARFWDRPEREKAEAVLYYHQIFQDLGLPIVLFYLYESAGGLKYSTELLDKLLGLSHVVGIKMATLDSVMTFQDVARHIKRSHPSKLLITGEDRFFGYSLMCGADAALVGMGSALTGLQAQMMAAYYAGDLQNFMYRSEWVDRLGMAAFALPIEGYITRMLYTLAWQGIVAPNATFDPWGPELDEADRGRLAELLAQLPTDLKH